jgi:nicotinate phosphoribosyltransferase
LEILGPKLWGVRLDTPASRRGDFAKIAEEVRWELDIRGGRKVKIIASGRLDEESIVKLNPIVDGYGVGTAVAYPPVIDLSAKIVEVGEGPSKEFRAKRGGLGGRKEVYRSPGFTDYVALQGSAKPNRSTPLLKPLIRKGKLVGSFEGLDVIRTRVQSDLDALRTATPSLQWR